MYKSTLKIFNTQTQTALQQSSTNLYFHQVYLRVLFILNLHHPYHLLCSPVCKIEMDGKTHDQWGQGVETGGTRCHDFHNSIGHSSEITAKQEACSFERPISNIVQLQVPLKVSFRTPRRFPITGSLGELPVSTILGVQR